MFYKCLLYIYIYIYIYIYTTPEFNKLMKQCFAGRFKKAKLVTKDDIADFVKKD